MSAGRAISGTELPRPVPAVIAVTWHRERVLLVRRHNPPNAGFWGFPGGKIEPGEPLLRAAERELSEETGVTGVARRVIDAVDVIGDGTPPRHHFLLVAVLVDWRAGTPRAADDVDEAAWFAPSALPEPRVADLERVLAASRDVSSASDPDRRA